MPVDEFVEFDKQYRSTYIRITYEKRTEKEVVYILECQDTGDKKLISVKGLKTGGCILNWEDSNQSFDYSFPKVGLFNYEYGMVYFYRLPERQWKRGIVGSNSQMVDPLKDIKLKIPELYKFYNSKIGLGFKELEAAYSEQFPSCIDDAVADLLSFKYEARAISPMFGLSLSSMDESSLILWKHTSMIGLLSLKEKEIVIKNQAFAQEIADYLRRKKEFAWNIR